MLCLVQISALPFPIHMTLDKLQGDFGKVHGNGVKSEIYFRAKSFEICAAFS